MAKERFLIVAVQMHDDSFGRFSESANRDAIDAGTADPNDAYSWIEASFEIQLRRWREATHICSFTPSARYEWIQNYFVGEPNALWNYDGDPDGLEMESGGEWGGYGDYQDDYDPRFVCADFTIDTVKDLGLRKPPADSRGFNNSDASGRYLDAIWDHAQELAHDMNCDGVAGRAPILDALVLRQWQREQRPMRFAA